MNYKIRKYKVERGPHFYMKVYELGLWRGVLHLSNFLIFTPQELSVPLIEKFRQVTIFQEQQKDRKTLRKSGIFQNSKSHPYWEIRPIWEEEKGVFGGEDILNEDLQIRRIEDRLENPRCSLTSSGPEKTYEPILILPNKLVSKKQIKN